MKANKLQIHAHVAMPMGPAGLQIHATDPEGWQAQLFTLIRCSTNCSPEGTMHKASRQSSRSLPEGQPQ
eukprot:1145659-Pelagomonas_calceolata.AAC.2